ncbi:hypothetical protein GCM10017161_20340 [Thalassotalea marina]|uniref:Uncharacterized protein n=1 Tax=Thalassotalea marina TaxID=1673741 RepID=A0A919BIW9_9GAMM|nr:hypothetical protein GCM10017161_20340 [Thalassotalea marina]
MESSDDKTLLESANEAIWQITKIAVQIAVYTPSKLDKNFVSGNVFLSLNRLKAHNKAATANSVPVAVKCVLVALCKLKSLALEAPSINSPIQAITRITYSFFHSLLLVLNAISSTRINNSIAAVN